jgi:small-conductance mechanosensitive channel
MHLKILIILVVLITFKTDIEKTHYLELEYMSMLKHILKFSPVQRIKRKEWRPNI